MTENTTTVRVGQPVPDFKLTTFEPTSGGFGEYSLEKAKKEGKWTILVFYPADFTFVCATEFAALAERHKDFKELGGNIVTVSCDTQFTHLAWQREEQDLKKVEYSMGADRTGKIARMFGVYMEENGLALRGSFIISPEGKLMSAEVNFLNLGRNMDELLRKFKANKYLAKMPAEVCPAEWKKEGDVTLKPGPELVGRVHQAQKR